MSLSAKTANYLRKTWICTGILNFAWIASTNIMSGIYKSHESSYNNDPIITSGQKGTALLLVTAFSICKSMMYFMAGPIGTYRIGLAYHNKYKTDDPNWTKPVDTLGYDNDRKYLVKPAGHASWFPIRSIKNNE